MWNTYIVHMPGFEKRKQPTFFVVARLTKQDVKMSSCHLFFTIHFTLNQMLLPYKQPKVLRHHDTERWQIKGKHNNLSCFMSVTCFFCMKSKSNDWPSVFLYLKVIVVCYECYYNFKKFQALFFKIQALLKTPF